MKLLLYASALMTGVLSLSLLRYLPSLWWFGTAALILPALVYFRQWLLCWLLIGYLWGGLDAARYLNARLPTDLARSEFLVSGVISTFPKSDGQRVSFEFTADQPVAAHWPGGKLRLSWRNPAQLPALGERWQFLVRLQPPSGMLNAGGFDYEAWLFVRNIVATGYVRGDAQQLDANADQIDRTRQRIRRDVMDASHTADADGQWADAAGLLAALLVGDRSGLNEQLRQEFQVTGTSHLIAISGLHIGIVALFSWLLATFFWSRSVRLMRLMPAPLVGAAASIIGAFLYAALAGFSIPTQRALIMTSVFAGATLLRLHYLPLDRYVLAVIAVVLFDPRSLWQPGFWFSFIAVLVLILLIQGQTKTAQQQLWKKYLACFKLAITAQFLLSFMMLPIQAYLGMPLSLISPIVNLLAVPWFSFVLVPLVLLAALLALLGAPAFFLPVLYLADWTLRALGLFAAQVYPLIISQHALMATVIAGASILWLALITQWRWRMLLMTLYLVSWVRLPDTDAPERLVLFDVGQGLAIYAEVGEQRLVYDLGPVYGSGFNTAEAVVLPYLRSRGINFIDKLIISHDDSDHRGDIDHFLARMPIGELIVGHPMKDRQDLHDRRCVAGENWQWGAVQFQFLHPQAQRYHSNSNDYSCVLLIRFSHFSVLLTGDITVRVERTLLGHAHLEDIDVVIVPHHGSNTSSSPSFARQLRPRYALVSAGYASRFGHPTEKVVENWQTAGAQVVNTADVGMITLKNSRIVADSWQLIGYRERNGRFWNR